MGYQIIENPKEEDIKTFKDSLKAFVDNLFPPENIRQINYIIKDNGNVIAGISSNTIYSMLITNALWVHEDYRRKGIATKLIEAAESKAIEYGCAIASVGTYKAFGALPFYLNHGYKVVTTNTESPPGETGYWLQKLLSPGN